MHMSHNRSDGQAHRVFDFKKARRKHTHKAAWDSDICGGAPDQALPLQPLDYLNIQSINTFEVCLGPSMMEDHSHLLGRIFTIAHL